MNWYLVKIVFQIVCDKGNHLPQFDEQLRLVEATGEQEAFAKAHAMGIQEEDCFLNNDQKNVKWSFINVAGLYQLNGITDGMELYSSIREPNDSENYINMVNDRAKNIAKKAMNGSVTEKIIS